MDRNIACASCVKLTVVALRKESVDRNGRITSVLNGLKQSLSARRAWIEIDFDGKLDADLWGRSPQGERG